MSNAQAVSGFSTRPVLYRGVGAMRFGKSFQTARCTKRAVNRREVHLDRPHGQIQPACDGFCSASFRQQFKHVAAKKPGASRDESRETYLLARDVKATIETIE